MTFLTRLLALLTLVVLASCGGGGGGGGSTGGGSGGNVVNTNLANLNISVGSLTPRFESNTTSYTVTVAFSNDSITITATPAANTATVTINSTAVDANNSLTSALVEGENSFVISITSGGQTKTYTVTVTRLAASAFAQQSYIKASNIETSDFFGADVAISGTTVIVGATLEDSDGSSQGNNSAADSGAVYVFVRGSNNWSQQTFIKASNVGADDGFGVSVAISGDTMVVGANQEDSDGSSEADDSSSNSGAAYVFTRTAGVWSQQAYLKASNIDTDDSFGTSVSIDGETIIVGATGESSDGSNEADDSLASSGAAYIFTRNGTTWTQQAYLKASNVDAGDEFGANVVVDGDTVIIGAANEDSDGSGESDNASSASGAAYVFTRNGTTWTQQAYLKASNPDVDDNFASSLDLEGDVAVIGAAGESSDGSNEADNSAVSSGAAYVYTRTGSAWTQQAYLKASNAEANDIFGASVGVNNGVIVVGASGESGDASDEADNSAAASGAAYGFTETAGVWSQGSYLKAFNLDAGDSYAENIAMEGGILVLGAKDEDSNGNTSVDNSANSAGAIYINQ